MFPLAIESQNCKFCNKAPETLVHLFCTCPVVVTYWENVSACISSFLRDSFFINNFNKVFGVSKINSNEHNTYLLNCLLLCARFVIYRCTVNMPTESQQLWNFINKCKN